jgi:LPS sulfotransferase NodH
MYSRIKRRLSRTIQVLLTGKVTASEKRVIPSITPEEVAEAKTFFPMEKFFIFGHARSGTTLLARLVRIHPQVHCNWQGHFFTRPPLLSGMAAGEEFEKWLARPSNRWNRGRDLTPVALRAMSDFVLEREARREGKTVVGDKSPNVLLNGQAVREVHTIYPDACLIYIVRDGRDTLVSHRFQNFIDASQHLAAKDLRIRDDFSQDPTPYYEGKRSIFTGEGIRRMAEGWVRNVSETDQLGREYYGDRYHSLRFEDLLREPYEMMAGIWRCLGVDPTGLEDTVVAEMQSNPDAEWQQYKAGDLVASLEKGKRGSWRDLFSERDKRIFKRVAGETLIAWGYEKDIDW